MSKVYVRIDINSSYYFFRPIVLLYLFKEKKKTKKEKYTKVGVQEMKYPKYLSSYSR